MNLIGLVFTLISSAFLLTLPRRLAAIPFLIGATYMTCGQEIELGPANFPVVRILVMVGMIRLLSKGEWIAGGMNSVDMFLTLWAILLIGTSVFHTSEAWIFRAGILWTDLGCYFLFRSLIQDWEDVRRIFKFLCVVLVPIAALMLVEKTIGKNYFAVFLGGISEIPALRSGHNRASGPFTHAILAGTVGATCLPMALYLWTSQRKYAIAGLFSSVGIVFASTSSGPIMMVFFILLGLALWKMRDHLRSIRLLILTGVIALDAVMKDPVYFLMARIDIAGGSTGYFRAQLIRSAIEHLDEWWLAGTDYTRNWMPSGISADIRHTDMTNHILWMGVLGGLPLMFIFIMTLVIAFRLVGRALQDNENASIEHRFLIWTLGAALFGHLCNFFSISLFDQSVIFFYLILACIGAVQARKRLSPAKAPIISRRSRLGAGCAVRLEHNPGLNRRKVLFGRSK